MEIGLQMSNLWRLTQAVTARLVVILFWWTLGWEPPPFEVLDCTLVCSIASLCWVSTHRIPRDLQCSQLWFRN